MRPTLCALVLLAAAAHSGGAAASSLSISPFADTTTVEVGRTRIVALEVDTRPQAAQTLDASSADPALLEVLGPVRIAAGAPLGYLRVRGLAPGTTTVAIGDAELKLEVVAPRSSAYDARFVPRIIGPSNGAVAWGVIAVGVEARMRPDRPLRRIVLQLPDGRRLDPIDDEHSNQPTRQLLYELDTAALDPGAASLRPVAIDEAGRERAGPPVHLRVIRPSAEMLSVGEAETRYELDRPERFGDERLTIGSHRDASGGRFFGNASAQPAVCYPLAVESPGWYQLVLTAGGTRAQGALPTVGVVIDGQPNATTNGRLLSGDWHRTPIGIPFRLDAGDRVITPLFLNDFAVPGVTDRNLRLDRIEIARIGDGATPSAASDAMMSMTMSAMTSGGPGAGAVAVEDPYGLTAAPLRIGFVRPLDGGVLPGLLEVEGRCWWDGADRLPPPTVTLLVNGRPAARQRSGAPRFWVDAGWLSPGDNTFQLVARGDGGTTASTATQTMRWLVEAVDEDRSAPRRHLRYSIHEDAWDGSVADRLHAQHNPKERRAASFPGNGRATLRLPDDLAGTFDLFLELRGDAFEGPAVASVGLVTGDEEHALGTIDAPGWWDTRRAAEGVELGAGPKQLYVAFENDHYEQGVGDRNLWLQAVILAEQPTSSDREVPVIAVTYPPDGHTMYMADALVAEVADDQSLASVELAIDGMLTGMRYGLNAKPGRVVFPLLLRRLDPGEHTLTVHARDVAGNTAISEPRMIVVTDTEPTEPGRYRRAIQVLNRFGYGPAPDDLASILTKGEQAWLVEQLRGSFDRPGERAALGAAFPFFPGQNQYEVTRRAGTQLLLTQSPARARFVHWVQNHFSTWIRKTDANRKWAEHIAFSRLGAAPFDHLLLASAESPAMLVYLDQDTSYAGRLNENYAREVMELHTLGVDGGYTQEDVTSLAALLTGWTAAREGDGMGGGPAANVYTHRFDPRLNDGRAVEVVGMPFDEAAPDDRYDRTRTALEMLAAHPSTARYVSRKLIEHYVGLPAPESMVDDLATVFHETGGDTGAMLATIAAHPLFLASADSPRVASAVDYGARLMRVTGHMQPWQLGDFLDRSGRGLFDRPTPDGYPEEDAYSSDSNALVQRWQLARRMQWPLAGLAPGPWRHGAATAAAGWDQAVVDVIAIRLTGDVLGERSNEAALQLLASTTGTPDERVRLLGPFVAQLPEANLR